MTVVKFPKAKKLVKRPTVLAITKMVLRSDAVETIRYRFFPWLGHALVNIIVFALASIRTLLLVLLMFIRPLVFFLVTPLTTALIIAFVICLFTQPDDTRLTWGFGLLTTAALFTMFLYDWLIFKLGGTVIHIAH